MVKEEDEIDTLPPDDDEIGGWGKKETTTFKDLVLRAIEKCRIEGSREMVFGGEIIKEFDGSPVIITIPNQINVFIESVKNLFDLLVFYFDEEANKNINFHFQKIKEIYTPFFEDYIKREEDEELIKLANKTGLIPRKEIREEYDPLIQKQNLDIWRLIYQELIGLFKRKKELSGKRTVRL